MGSSWTRDQTHVPCIGRWILNHWTMREVSRGWYYYHFGCSAWHSVSYCKHIKLWLPVGRSVSFPGGSDGKESACNVGDPGPILESWRLPGGRNDNPLKHTCLGNPRTKKPGGLQSMGLQKAGHNWLINTLGSSVAFTFNNIDFYISYRSNWFLLLFFTNQYLNQLTISGESLPNGAVQALHYRH